MGLCKESDDHGTPYLMLFADENRGLGRLIALIEAIGIFNDVSFECRGCFVRGMLVLRRGLFNGSLKRVDVGPSMVSQLGSG